MELVPANPPADLGSMLDSQRDLFHSQIEQLQRIVITQSRLTGVNPLSQEMAAGALAINIGKRPRDMLNPKAVKYMQAIFSVKDTIGKKETREISAICGITLTQVRDYFAGQRSRVRKSIHLSRDKALKLNDSNHSKNCSPVKNVSENKEHEPVTCTRELATVPDTPDSHNSSPNEDRSLLNCADNRISGECSTSLSQEIIPDINLEDKKFLENIFTLMRREQNFSGQAKLMEWILQINNSAILFCFLTKGGATILASWLSLYAIEEQTSMILVIFKVLCHLPLHKAPPLQLSSILETINKLRFYRMPDISNKARFLLSRWSKMLGRNQTLKRFSSLRSNGVCEELLGEQRISEILSSKTWKSEVDVGEKTLVLAQEGSKSHRQQEHKQLLKLLPPAGDNSGRKHGRIISASKTRERRKVLLVEQPDRVTARNTAVFRAVPANHSRPISADDILKAKMRASLMQNKNGKTDASTTHVKDLLAVKDKKSIASLNRKVLAPKSSESTGHEAREPVDVNDSQPLTGILNGPNPVMLEKLTSHQIPWQMPPEMAVNAPWSVGYGDNSKEVEVQISRNKREREVIYQKTEEIPENPKEPWDIEIDFDDSLTPEIPVEQLDNDEAATGTECTASAATETSIAGASVSPVQGIGDFNMSTLTEILSTGHSMYLSLQTENASMANSTSSSSTPMYVPMDNSFSIPSEAMQSADNSMPIHLQAMQTSIVGSMMQCQDPNVGNSMPIHSQATQTSVGSFMHLPVQCQDPSVGNSMLTHSQDMQTSIGSSMHLPLQGQGPSVRNSMPIHLQDMQTSTGSSSMHFSLQCQDPSGVNSTSVYSQGMQIVAGSSMQLPLQSQGEIVANSTSIPSQVMQASFSSSSMQSQSASVVDNPISIPLQCRGGDVDNSMSIALQALQTSRGSSMQIPLQCQDASVGDSSTSRCMPSFMSIPPQIDAAPVNNHAHLPAPTPSYDSSNRAAEPDLELLAVLLKNPDLVLALTSGQANGISESHVVALLDLLKKSGAGLNGISTQLNGNPVGRPAEITRLPSPTPPEEVLGESNHGQKTIKIQSTPQSHLLGSCMDPTTIYTADAQPSSRSAPGDLFAAASLPRSAYASVGSSSLDYDVPTHKIPSRNLSQSERRYLAPHSMGSSPSNYDVVPTHQMPSTNLSQNEAKFLARWSIAPAAASGDDAPKEYATTSVPFHTPHVVATSSSSRMDSTSRGRLSDFRPTNHPNSPNQTFHTNAKFEEHARSVPRSFPASGGARREASLSPMDDHFPSLPTDGAANHEENRFSSRGYHYCRNQFAPRLSQSAPVKEQHHTRASTDRMFDGFRRDQDGTLPRQVRYLDDDYDDYRVQQRRRVSGEDECRRDWDCPRHSDHSRHSPGKRRWRDRDRRY